MIFFIINIIMNAIIIIYILEQNQYYFILLFTIYLNMLGIFLNYLIWGVPILHFIYNLKQINNNNNQ